MWGLGLMLRELLCLDPRSNRLAEAALPPELAQVLARATSRDVATRTRSTQQLCDELAAWSDGSSRAEQAEQHLASARAAWRARQSSQKDSLDLRSQVARLEREVPGWAPLDHPVKAALHSTRERLAELEEQVEVLFAQAVSAAERARAHAPELAGAKELLAEAWWSRFEQAERRGDRPAQARCAPRRSPWAAT